MNQNKDMRINLVNTSLKLWFFWCILYLNINYTTPEIAKLIKELDLIKARRKKLALDEHRDMLYIIMKWDKRYNINSQLINEDKLTKEEYCNKRNWELFFDAIREVRIKRLGNIYNIEELKELLTKITIKIATEFNHYYYFDSTFFYRVLFVRYYSKAADLIKEREISIMLNKIDNLEPLIWKYSIESLGIRYLNPKIHKVRGLDEELWHDMVWVAVDNVSMITSLLFNDICAYSDPIIWVELLAIIAERGYI